MANEENLVKFRLKRSQKNAKKLVNNLNNPQNVRKQRLSYEQRKMDADKINEYLDDINGKIKELDKKTKDDGKEPLKVLDLNSRCKFADTSIKFVQMQKEHKIFADEDDEFDEIIKNTKVVSTTYKRDKRNLDKG